MAYHVAILEDDTNRLLEMKACLDELLPEYVHCFFDSATEMVNWLEENISSVVLISLDHDLPIIQYRMGKRVEAGTGRFVADYLATREPVCPVIVHSLSSNNGEGMARVLTDTKWPVTRIQPFGEYEWVRQIWKPLIENYISQGWIFSTQRNEISQARP